MLYREHLAWAGFELTTSVTPEGEVSLIADICIRFKRNKTTKLSKSKLEDNKMTDNVYVQHFINLNFDENLKLKPNQQQILNILRHET